MKKSLPLITISLLFLIASPVSAASINAGWGFSGFNSVKQGDTSMNVHVSGGTNSDQWWRATSYATVLTGQTPSAGQFVCIPTSEETSGTTHAEIVAVPTPHEFGTYDLYARAYDNTTCSGNPIAEASNLPPEGIEVCGANVCARQPTAPPVASAPAPTPTPPPAPEPVIQTVYVPVYVPALVAPVPVPAPADEPVVVAANAATTVDTTSREATIESLYRQIIALLTQYLQLLLAAKGQ